MSPEPLILHDLSKSYADAAGVRVVLDGLDLVAAPGERVGLIGQNGAGKSTALRLAVGLESPDAGTVSAPADLGHLAQDSGLDPGASVAQVMREALAPLHAGIDRLETLASALAACPGDGSDPAAAYAAQLAWVEAHQAWDADRRAAVAAQRLGFGPVDDDRCVGDLSGGRRTRLALAALLTRRPDCLVLDEPTNHLDDEALDFLESELLTSAGAVLVASHDRVFLERVCTRLVDLDPSAFGTDGQGGRVYAGGYRAYLSAKRDSERRWARAHADQQDELGRLRARTRVETSDIAHDRGPRDNDKFIHHFKGQNVQATQRRRVRDAQRRIEVIERDPIPRPPAPLVFAGSFADTGAARVQVRDLHVPGRVSLARLDVEAGEKVLVSGPNGCGKSTLLSVIAGRLDPAAGHVQVQARRIGHLPQQVTFADADATAQQIYDASGAQVSLRELGILRPADLNRPVGVLSQGQRQRLGLAMLMGSSHDLLLLDEPTNHVSLALVDDLDQAVRETSATVLLAAHDRWLRRAFRGREVRLTAAG